MGSDQSNGILGLFALIGCVVLYFAFRKQYPVLAIGLLITAAIVLLLLILLVGLVIYWAFHKPEDKKTAEADAVTVMLQKGRVNLLELRKLSLKIKNQRVRFWTEEICRSVERILSTLKEQPEKMSQVRQVLNYCLPSFGTILMKYKRLEDSGVPVEETTENTISCLQEVKFAMDKQYEKLFYSDILDLNVEMEVLISAFKRDGLLTDEDFVLQEQEQEITLTL